MASQRAYSPYSGFHVGVAIRLDNQVIVEGNNQENAAYPSGLCAERVALFYSNSAYPDAAPIEMAISAHKDGLFTNDPIMPCGACRQVMLESEVRFKKHCKLILYSNSRIFVFQNHADLLPFGFSKDSLE